MFSELVPSAVSDIFLVDVGFFKARKGPYTFLCFGDFHLLFDKVHVKNRLFIHIILLRSMQALPHPKSFFTFSSIEKRHHQPEDNA